MFLEFLELPRDSELKVIVSGRGVREGRSQRGEKEGQGVGGESGRGGGRVGEVGSDQGESGKGTVGRGREERAGRGGDRFFFISLRQLFDILKLYNFV